MTNTLFIGKVYRHFTELASTNDYARELIAKSKPPEGTAIRAASQSAGRGQFGSRWESMAGKNLLLSIILYPNWLLAADQFRLSEAVAIALRETVAGAPGMDAISAETVTIKWPNDIWIGTRKVAGILIQNTLKGSTLESSIVGVGLNVNQLEFPETLPFATSMAIETGTTFELDLLMTRFFECLERRYLQLKNGQIEALRKEYHRYLFGLGMVRTFRRPEGGQFQGVIQGVARDGMLVVRTDEREEHFAVKGVQMF